jgi:hypothetical protein
MGNADLIFAGAGRCLSGPAGTTLPADIDDMASLDPALVDLGIVSEDGLEHAFNPDKTIIKDWNGRPVRTIGTAVEITFKLRFLETNAEVVQHYYGTEVQSAGTGSKVVLGQPSDPATALVIPTEDAATGAMRVYVLPRAEVSDRGDQTVKPDETGYELTFTALYDPDLGSCGYVLYSEDLTALTSP